MRALIVDRFGEPDEKRSFQGTDWLSYKLKDGRFLTFNLKDSQVVWSGIRFDLEGNVGKTVEIRGILTGPGKISNYIVFHDGQTVKYDIGTTRDTTFEDKLQLGDEVIATGVLRYKPKCIPKSVSKGFPGASGESDYYYLEKGTFRSAQGK